MKSINQKLGTGLAIALTVSISTLAQAQPASAQLLEIAAGALNALTGNRQQPQVIRQPVPLPSSNRNFRFGTNNLNGNNFNFCFSGCLPNTAAATPQQPQYPVFPPRPIPVGVPQQQGTFASTNVHTSNGTLPPGAVPQRFPVQAGVPAPRVIPPPVRRPLPPRPPASPVLTIPPIQLPINF